MKCITKNKIEKSNSKRQKRYIDPVVLDVHLSTFVSLYFRFLVRLVVSCLYHIDSSRGFGRDEILRRGIDAVFDVAVPVSI